MFKMLGEEGQERMEINPLTAWPSLKGRETVLLKQEQLLNGETQAQRNLF